MNEHADRWIDAYLDGEMPAAQKRHAEAHLAQCPACRNLLAQRRSLSSLLQAVPPAVGLKHERQFAAEVGLQLIRQPVRVQPRYRALRLTWYLVPIMLLQVLAFSQAVSILSSALALVPGAQSALLSQVAGLPSLQVTLPEPVEEAVQAALLGQMGMFDLAGWNWLTGIVIFFLIGLIYLGWLASWWARSQRPARRIS